MIEWRCPECWHAYTQRGGYTIMRLLQRSPLPAVAVRQGAAKADPVSKT